MADKKIIKLGFCPRCKEGIDESRMTRVVSSVEFCWLCSFDVEEDRMEKERWVKWAKEYESEMM